MRFAPAAGVAVVLVAPAVFDAGDTLTVGLLVTLGVGLLWRALAGAGGRPSAGSDAFKLFADSMPVGVFRVSAEGVWLYGNPRLLEILGVPVRPSAEVGEAWAAAVHPEDRDRVLSSAGEPAARAEPDFEIEYRICRPDGEVRWVVVRTAPRFGEHGELLWYQGAVSDVTDRRSVEHSMRASEADYRGLAMSMPVGIVRRDTAGRPTFVNRALLEIAGLPPGTTAAEISVELFHPEDQDAAVEAMQHTLRTGEGYERELRIVRADGEVRVVVTRGSVQHDGDGDITGYVATLVDVTARRSAEQAVRLQEQRYRTLTSAVPAGILRMDTQGTWVFANEYLRDLWHMSHEQDPGELDWASRLHADDRDRVVADWAAAMQASGVYEGEFRIMAPDGSSRWAWTRAATEYDGAGDRVGYLATTFDVDERHTAALALSRSEQRHRLTINNVPGVVIGLYDRDLRCLFMEGEGTDENLSTAACAGRTLTEFANQETADRLEPGMRDALAGDERSYAYHSPRDGTYRENHVGPLRSADGEIEGVIVVSRDVTDRQIAEQARRAAEEQFRVAFERAPIGIVSIDLTGRLGQVNQALCDMTGYSAEALLALDPFALIHRDDRARVQSDIDGLGTAQDTAAIELRLTHAAGHTVWIDARIALIRGDSGEPIRMLAQLQDISDRRQYEQHLHHLADHDPLTGLLNRRALERELKAHLARTRRYHSGGALLLVDLDGFKNVNDTLGHAAGDDLIMEVATVLRTRLRESDQIARLGGDEFAIILPTQSIGESALVAQALVDAIRVHAAGRGQPITASVGLAGFERDLTIEQMLARADGAMYEAKQAGRNRYATHAPNQSEHRAPQRA